MLQRTIAAFNYVFNYERGSDERTPTSRPAPREYLLDQLSQPDVGLIARAIFSKGGKCLCVRNSHGGVVGQVTESRGDSRNVSGLLRGGSFLRVHRRGPKSEERRREG